MAGSTGIGIVFNMAILALLAPSVTGKEAPWEINYVDSSYYTINPKEQLFLENSPANYYQGIYYKNILLTLY